MTEHTDSPWYVVDLGELHFLDTNHRYGIESPKTATRQIAKVEGTGSPRKANACLIAAAPELYEELCCRLAQTRCDCGHPACRRCKDDTETERVLAKARGDQ